MTPQDPLGAVPRQKASSRLWGRLLGRQVIRHPDGSVQLRGFSARAVIRWYREQNWGAK